MPTRVDAVALPTSAETPEATATALAAQEREHIAIRRRIRASRTTLIVGAGVLTTGAIILAATLAAGAPQSRDEDGNDGFEFLYGAIPVGIGFLTMMVSGPIFIVNKNRLSTLAESRRLTLKVRPSLSANTRETRGGLALELRF